MVLGRRPPEDDALGRKEVRHGSCWSKRAGTRVRACDPAPPRGLFSWDIVALDGQPGGGLSVAGDFISESDDGTDADAGTNPDEDPHANRDPDRRCAG